MSYAFTPADFESARRVPVPDRAPAADRVPVFDYAPARAGALYCDTRPGDLIYSAELNARIAAQGGTPPRAPAAPAAIPRPLVLGLSGPGGCGKSTVARALVAALGDRATVLPVNAPLKAAMRAILEAGGLTPVQINRRLDGDLKRVPCAILGGRTPTDAMQTMGTEWGRQMVHPDLWVDLWRRRAEVLLAAGGAVLNDSVRFENEVAAIHALGGVVVRLTGRAGDLDGANGHASERGVAADFEVANTGTPDATAAAILDALAARQIEAGNRGAGGIWSRMMDTLHGRADRPKW